MFPASKPQLRIFKNKLHVSRRPGFYAWLFLSLSVLIFIAICRRLTDNAFFLSILMLGELMCSLDALGEWEDLVLDKELNRATIVRSSWSEKLCSRVPDMSAVVMRLSDIRHVGVSTEIGLFMIHKNGTTTTISTRGLSRREVQNLRREINYFLNMSRIEHLDTWPADPYRRLLNASDSEDECVKNIPIDVIDNWQPRCPVQQILSTPILSSQRRDEIRRQSNLRRGPYTENSKYSDCPRCTRQECLTQHRFRHVEAM